MSQAAEESRPSPFADQFRRARKSKGWSQHKAAVALGVHYRTVQNWERGDQEPELSLWRRICLAFGWPLPEWLSEDGSTRVLLGGKPPLRPIRGEGKDRHPRPKGQTALHAR